MLLWKCSCKQLIRNAQPVSWAFLCAIRDVLHFSVVFDVGLCVCNEHRTPKSDDCAFCCWMEEPAVAQPEWFTVLSTETDFKEISFWSEDHINVMVLGAGDWLESQNGRMVSPLPCEPLVSHHSQWLLSWRWKLCLLILLVFWASTSSLTNKGGLLFEVL